MKCMIVGCKNAALDENIICGTCVEKTQHKFMHSEAYRRVAPAREGCFNKHRITLDYLGCLRVLLSNWIDDVDSQIRRMELREKINADGTK